MTLELELALLVVVLLTSAFFSGSEVAVLAASRIRVKLLAEQGKRSAQALDYMLQAPSRLLATILIGNNLANTATTALTTVLVAHVLTEAGLDPHGGEVVVVATLIATVFLLVVGEITPKGIAVSFAEPFALTAARPLRWMQIVLRPVIATFSLLTVAVEKVLPGKPRGELSMTPEELRHLAVVLSNTGVLVTLQADILQNVAALQSIQARDVMIPRTEVAFVPADATREKLLEILRDRRYTRYPVYEPEKGFDEIVGILHMKDIMALPLEDGEIHVRELAAKRPPVFVPEFMKVSTLFRQLQETRGQMAVVVDEYGGTAGIVALEDIVEEIVGEIVDEFEPAPIRRITDFTYVCLGNVRLVEVAETVGVAFEDAEGVDTLAGYVLHRLGRLPRDGEVVEAPGMTLTVREVDKQRIRRIQVTRHPRSGDEHQVPPPTTTQGDSKAN